MKKWFLLAGLVVAACTPIQVSASLLTSYDAAVSVETLALASGEVSPQEATSLRAARVAAMKAVQAVVAAEASGGNAAGLVALAQQAVSNYLAIANAVKGS